MRLSKLHYGEHGGRRSEKQTDLNSDGSRYTVVVVFVSRCHQVFSAAIFGSRWSWQQDQLQCDRFLFYKHHDFFTE